VVTSSTQPALGTIRLAWWREALERLDHGSPPPEPRLQAVASHLVERGLSGKALAALEDGWATLLDEIPDPERIGNRGALLFEAAGKLLGGADPKLATAGRLFAIQQAARKRLLPPYRPESELESLAGHVFQRGLRPLTAMARLAARDARQTPVFEPEATPARAVALLSHRLFGRVA
jgi:phytoene synthase